MDRDPFGHRKYHGLYFILGFIIACLLVITLSGCERGKDNKGRACTAVLGVGVTGDACEPEVIIIEPTDPPSCWYPDAPEEYCEPQPVNCCMALIPSCMACADSCTVDEWLEKTCGPDAIDADYAGWDPVENKPIWLCQAEIID